LPPQAAVSGKSILLALALGAAPGVAALFFLKDPLEPSDLIIAGAALLTAVLLAWKLRESSFRITEGQLLAGALLLAAAPTLIAAVRLDTTITNDEQAYIFQAELMSEGRLAEALAPQSELYQRRQVFNDEARGIRYAKYPPGTAMGLLPGVLTGWPLLSTFLAGLLDVLLLTAIGRRLGLGSPALAGLLLVLSPFFLLVQTSAQSEVFALPAVLGGYWALLRVRESSAGSRAAFALGCVAGACSGFVFLGRPLTGLLMALALGLGFTLSERRLPALCGAVLCGLPFAAFMLFYNQALTGDAFTIPYHQYALRYGPFDSAGQAIDVFGQGDFAQGFLDQIGRWSVAFAGILGAAALGFWGLWRLRARDGGAALCFALLGPLVYSFHWYQGHKAYLGPLYCYESLGLLLCGALALLQAAPERVRRGIVLTAIIAGPAAFIFRFDSIQELSDVRSAPQRAAGAAPPGAIVLLAPGSRGGEWDNPDKYYTPSRPTLDPQAILLLRAPARQAVPQVLRQANLAGRPIYLFVPDPDYRSGQLQPLNN
jgi:hypothetical protein